MKRIITPTTLSAVFATAFGLGIVPGAYAQQKSVSMTFSGNGGASAISLPYDGTATGEENVTGNGTFGQFTLRNVTAHAAAPSLQPPPTCSGPTQIYVLRVAGAGIFRFEDGSLLMVELTEGSDCIDFAPPQGHCRLTLKITGGTGRFKDASGTLTYTETALPAFTDALHPPVYFAETGKITGTVFGVAAGEGEQDAQH